MAEKGKSGRILILEDDVDILEVLKLMLEYEGHRVITAKNGTAALAIAKEKPFDVAVLDISMPDISGIEVARALRADPKTAHVKIAIHTALDERWVHERFPDYDLFLAKARDVDVLVEGVAKLVSAPAGDRAAAAAAPTFSADEALRAQQALREAIGLGPELHSVARLAALLGDEIGQLRRLGRSDAEIAALIASATGRDFPPSLLATALAAVTATTKR